MEAKGYRARACGLESFTFVEGRRNYFRSFDPRLFCAFVAVDENFGFGICIKFKAAEKKLVVLESIKLTTAKTKEWVDLMKAQPTEGRRALCVVKESDSNLKKASRNMLEWVDVKEARNFTAYDVLQRDRLIIDQDALSAIEARVIGTKSAKEAGAE